MYMIDNFKSLDKLKSYGNINIEKIDMPSFIDFKKRLKELL